MRAQVCLPSQPVSYPLERDTPTHLAEEDLTRAWRSSASYFAQADTLSKNTC